jgi:GTP-binding protein EngB required for normal cell division
MVANLLKEGINFAIIWTKIDKGRQKEKHKTAEDFKKELQKIMAKFSKV